MISADNFYFVEIVIKIVRRQKKSSRNVASWGVSFVARLFFSSCWLSCALLRWVHTGNKTWLQTISQWDCTRPEASFI